jgi:hypothetical protein
MIIEKSKITTAFHEMYIAGTGVSTPVVALSSATANALAM